MRAHLSKAKTDLLYYKLVTSMCEKNDFEAAKKYVAKGADLDRLFWTRQPYALSFGSMIEGLPNDRLQLQMRNYTPLLYAAEARQTELCNLMRSLLANTEIQGKCVEFHRDILQIIDASRLP